MTSAEAHDTLTRIAEAWGVDCSQRSPIEIPNKGRDAFAGLFATLGFLTGVEVGVERGHYSEVLCAANPQATKIYGVDPWTQLPGYREHVSKGHYQHIRQRALALMAPFSNWEPIRGFSVDVAARFADGSLDWVYLDGNHDLLHVIQDLYAWMPKLRPGGIISGHDFLQRKRDVYEVHVVEAVYAYTGAHFIKPWFLLGRRAIVEGEVRDRPRSWFWVKG